MQVDFQLGRPSGDARIVVAMSGGVDSSVTAALAARTGAEVIGVTLQLYDHGEAVRRSGACCAGRDIYDAKMVAVRRGSSCHVPDYDSQDICFVPDGNDAGLVKRLRPETQAPGDIVDLNGRVLGRHQGVIHFTVGQRRGIEVGGQKEPLYVIRIERETARIVVGPRRALAVDAMRVHDWNWLGEGQRNVTVKVRSLAPAVPAVRDGDWVRFDQPEYGVALGQA